MNFNNPHVNNFLSNINTPINTTPFDSTPINRKIDITPHNKTDNTTPHNKT